jgi:hypothetical protein
MITRIDADPEFGTITVKQLREFLAQLPDCDDGNEPNQVLIQTAFAETSGVKCITLVGSGCDILLQTAESAEFLPP